MATIKELFFELVHNPTPERKAEIKKIIHQYLLDKGNKPSNDLKAWYNPNELNQVGLGFDSSGSLAVIDTGRFTSHQMEIRAGYTASRAKKQIEAEALELLVNSKA